ncbi:uncharacterized protein METZ01_LOCUS119429 [marine metagenome]|jgi:hypothetical protein|uniref:Uncharacterized protein n=1 Tax=marine metagenome TaxID=408172 RepID=A0A381XPA1_9ZZZZ
MLEEVILEIKAESHFLLKLKNSYIFYRRTVYLKTKIIKSTYVWLSQLKAVLDRV